MTTIENLIYEDFYKEVKATETHGALKDQLHRASLSIVLNLAEGTERPTLKDRKRFFSTSLTSLREVQAIIDIEDITHLAQKADILGAHIYKLHQRAQ